MFCGFEGSNNLHVVVKTNRLKSISLMLAHMYIETVTPIYIYVHTYVNQSKAMQLHGCPFSMENEEKKELLRWD